MLKTSRKVVRVGPEDHGRRMSLDRFERAVGQEGYTYELSRGVIEVTDVPHPRHFAQLNEIRRQLILYQATNLDAIHAVAGSNECKLLVGPTESERHPDLSVYLSEPPAVDDVWSLWKPAIVVAIVSRSSMHRDYEEKPGDYLELGIDEYWIVDAIKNQMTALTRWRGQWKPKIVKASQKHATHLLPGFALDLRKVFAAAK